MTQTSSRLQLCYPDSLIPSEGLSTQRAEPNSPKTRVPTGCQTPDPEDSGAAAPKGGGSPAEGGLEAPGQVKVTSPSGQ